MPYIKQDERERFDDEIEQLALETSTPGQVAYVVYRYMLLVIRKFGGNFSAYAGILGAATEAIGEARRRLHEREDQQRERNGDVAT